MNSMKLSRLDRFLIKLAIAKNAARWSCPVISEDSLKRTAQEAVEAFRVVNASASGIQADGREGQ
jgi:hypothetical protein